MDVKKKSVAVMVRTMIEEVCFKIRTVFIAAKKQKSFPRVLKIAFRKPPF